jgi:hypothetical protein
VIGLPNSDSAVPKGGFWFWGAFGLRGPYTLNPLGGFVKGVVLGFGLPSVFVK